MEPNDYPRVVDALIQTPDAETHYRRAGSGRAVLLLADHAADPAAACNVFAEIATRFRVFAPRAAPRSGGSVTCGGRTVDAAAWLASMIDALGLDRPIIVADAAFAAIADTFASSDPERVAHVLPADDVAGGAALLPRLLAL